MPCLLGCLALFFPRIALVLLYLLNPPYLQQAYQTTIWPVLGFIFMPFTTLAYAWAWHYGNGSIQGIGLVVVVIAVLADLGTLFGGASRKEVRKYYVVRREP
ncbi:MAG: hypothetical protein L0Y42_04950 [Phycisphaerales bacterium]|nr:hypothetical protein [Phycisphaerales bacterium]